MTSSVTNPGKAFARIALALAIAAMGIYVASSDPPGGAVVGFLLMLAAVLFGVRTAQSGCRPGPGAPQWRSALSLPRSRHFSSIRTR